MLNGVVLNEVITHPSMRRRVENPRIVLLDCQLEYSEREYLTSTKFFGGTDSEHAQNIEEDRCKTLVDKILGFKPDLAINEKGVPGTFLLVLKFSRLSLYFASLSVRSGVALPRQI